MSLCIYRSANNSLNRKHKKWVRAMRLELTAGSKGRIIHEIHQRNASSSLREIKRFETVVFLTHGGHDRLYHKMDYSLGQRHVTLIDTTPQSLRALKNKKVIAWACGTGLVLGKEAVEHGCIAYFGLKTAVHYDRGDKNPESRKYRQFLIDCYRDCLAVTLKQAIQEGWTMEQFRLMLERELCTTVEQRTDQFLLENEKLYKTHGMSFAVLAVTNVAQNMIVHGDGTAVVQ